MTLDSSAKPAVFLDRDGVLNEDLGYIDRPDRIRLLPEVPEALRLLRDAGYRLVVVTNQSGVARGYFTEEAVRACNEALEAAVRRDAGIGFDLILYCPHHPEGIIPQYRLVCPCRKPAPGMILTAQDLLALDMSRSVMIGDKPDDIECGHRAGIRGLQVKTPLHPAHPQADHVGPSLRHLTEWLLQHP